MASCSRHPSTGQSRDAKVAEVVDGTAYSLALHAPAVDPVQAPGNQGVVVFAEASAGRLKGCCYALATARTSERAVAIGRSPRTLARHIRCRHTGSRSKSEVEVDEAVVVHTAAVARVLETVHHRVQQKGLISLVAAHAVLHILRAEVVFYLAVEAFGVGEGVARSGTEGCHTRVGRDMDNSSVMNASFPWVLRRRTVLCAPTRCSGTTRMPFSLRSLSARMYGGARCNYPCRGISRCSSQLAAL